MRTTRRFFPVAMMLLACAALPSLAQAGRVQGFESGDPAVVSIGDAGAHGDVQGESPPEGSKQYLLTTIGATSNEDTLGNQSGAFAVGNSTLQSFFHNISLAGVEGSGVLIPLTIGAGDTQLTFQYDFLSNENFQILPRNDFAFAALFDATNALQGNVTTFASVNGSTFSQFNPGIPFQFHTGYQTLTLSLAGLAPGNYTLGIGVEDAVTADHASAVLLDNVLTVPEASPFVLALTGAALLLAVCRRIKHA
jgi:hypothetical protein